MVQINREGKFKVVLVPRLSISIKAQFVLVVTTLTILPFKLESRVGVMVYNP